MSITPLVQPEVKASYQDNLFEVERCIENYKKDINQSDALLSAFTKLFDQLMIDSESYESLYAQINTQTSLEDKYSYIQSVHQLLKKINDLESTCEYKQLLLERFYDNFNITEIDKFEQNKAKNRETAVRQWFKANEIPSLINTVEVRSWGVRNEYGNGLRAVIDKCLKGDDVGHVSLVMRIPADEYGLSLIKKYCIHKSGALKVPYEIKKYHNQVVYEVYWSFWPGKNHSFKEDVIAERSGNEFIDIKRAEAELPIELSNKYLLHKYRKGNVITLANAANGIKTTNKQSIHRSQYIFLKIKKNKLNEEIVTLQYLINHYLENGEVISSEHTVEEVLKDNSNFLVLLERFKHQFSDRKLVSKILLQKSITRAQASRLVKLVISLKDEKKKEIAILKEEIQKKAFDVQIDKCQIKKLKRKIKESRSKLKKSLRGYHQSVNSIEPINKIIDYFTEIKNCGEALVFPIQINEAILSNYKKIFQLPDKYIAKRTLKQFDQKRITTVNFLNYAIEDFIQYKKHLVNAITKFDELNYDDSDIDALHKLYTEPQTDLSDNSRYGLSDLQQEIEDKTKLISALDTFIALCAQQEKSKQELDEYINLKYKIKELAQAKRSVVNGASKNIYFSINGEPKEKIVSNIGEIQEVEYLINSRLNELASSIETIRKNANTKVKAIEIKLEQYKIRTISHMNAARSAKQSLEQQLSQLQDQRRKKTEVLKLAHLVPRKHTEEILENSMMRGLPFKKTTLQGFDIEHMLQRASELSETTDNFGLKKENCSSTSMKILNAGAPEDKKDLFYWAEPSEDDIYAKNAFITNPQAVHSSASICQALENGGWQAKLIARGIRNSQNNGEYYYQTLNQLADNEQEILTNSKKYFQYLIDTYLFRKGSDLNEEQIQSLKSDFSLLCQNIWQLISWPFNNINFISDYFFIRSIHQTEAQNLMVSDVNTAIKTFSDGKHNIITENDPEMALCYMYLQLKKSSTSIPFYSDKTFEVVESYILSLEAKEEVSLLDQDFINLYQLIKKEKNARIDVVETALVTGDDVEKMLQGRDQLLDDLPQKLQKHYKLTTFLEAYQKEKNAQFLSYLRPGVLSLLTSKQSVWQKLEVIEENIVKKPQSISAKVWSQVISMDSEEAQQTHHSPL